MLFDSFRPHQMPTFFGPRPLKDGGGHYRDVTTLVVPYLTDAKRLARYLPKRFHLDGEPVVQVVYAMNRQVEWLAGRGYNLIEVMVPVEFKGEADQLRGHLALVLWENLCDPILTGRENEGMPKLFAEIDDPEIDEGIWRISARHFGHEIVDMTVHQQAELTRAEIDARQQAGQDRDHWFGWRYMPKIGGIGMALEEPTVFPLEQTIGRAWQAAGEVTWALPTWEQNPTQFHIVNALAELPIVETRPATIMRGSTTLYPKGRAPRVLR